MGWTVRKADAPLHSTGEVNSLPGSPSGKTRAQQRPGLTALTALTGKSPREVPGPDENAESLQMSQEDAPDPKTLARPAPSIRAFSVAGIIPNVRFITTLMLGLANSARCLFVVWSSL